MVLLSLLLDVQDGKLLKYFNPLENTRRIFFVKKGERRRSLFVDLNKTTVVLVAIVMHILSCADSPRSTAYLSHTNVFRELLRNIFVQLVTFEGGFNALAFLRWVTHLINNSDSIYIFSESQFAISSSGLNTFNEVYPSLQKNQVNFYWLAFNKWLRYVPALASLMSLELLWPLLSSGPLWTENSELLVRKIEEYWWAVFTYTSNFVPFQMQPICHTNYSMIDFQLYLLGMIGVYLLFKTRRKGFIFAAFMILSGYTSLWIHVWLYDVQPHFIHPSALLRYVNSA